MSEENVKICPFCGSENSAQSKFCTNCGVALQEQKEISINYGPENGEGYENSAEYSGETSSAWTGTVVEEETKVEGGNIGIAIASMVCGILSIPCCCLWVFSALLGVAAVVLGIITFSQKYDGRGMAIAGIITGGIGLILALGWLLMMSFTALI